MNELTHSGLSEATWLICLFFLGGFVVKCNNKHMCMVNINNKALATMSFLQRFVLAFPYIDTTSSTFKVSQKCRELQRLIGSGTLCSESCLWCPFYLVTKKGFVWNRPKWRVYCGYDSHINAILTLLTKLGPVSISRCCFTSIGNLIVEIRRSYGHLISWRSI